MSCAPWAGKHAIYSSVIAGVIGAALVFASGVAAIAQTTPQQAEAKPAPAQTAKPPTPPTQSTAPKDATPATVLDDKDVETVLGREIYSVAGEDMGRIVDILVDHKGNVRAALIDFGGFLGVGSRKIAVDWHAIQFTPNRALLSLVRDQVRVAPEYKEGEPVVVLGSPSPSAPQEPHPAEKAKPGATAPAK